MKKQNTNKIAKTNLQAWEEAAPIHRNHNQAEELQLFKQAGHSCLDEIETQVLKNLDVSGKDVAQICCNNGRELISVKNLGANRCVGFDGAQGFIDQARELADAAKLDVEFVCTDIYDIEGEFDASFDIVTITIGVLSWMPDLEEFFKVISKMLRKGGTLFIYEQHPIMMMIEPGEAEAPIVWELSYFDKEPYVETGGLDYFGGESYDAKPATSFAQTMAEIIMAGIETGLQVEHFEEYSHHISNTWWNVEHSGMGLPMCFTLVFRKSPGGYE